MTMKENDKNEMNQIFDLLDQWRLLPAYQLERRADIFFAIYLKEIIENCTNYSVEKIIPEFPVRVGTVYPERGGNQSFKIDYLVICKETVLLIELKTDAASRRNKQDEYLIATKNAKISELIDGLSKIYEASTSKVKYTRLRNELSEIDWSEKKNIEIIYIQPVPNENEDTGGDNPTFIYFETIAKLLEKKDSKLAQRFAKSLKKWKISPNEKQADE